MASSTRQPTGVTTAKVSDVIANFQPTRRFGSSGSEKPYSVTSIDFDDTGELALVARDDETLQIYNCKEGKHAKELKSQKYGVDLARFAHHPQSIIYASTKGDDAIRYLSSHDNSYIRYFRGHSAPVTCITLNPSSDEFMSASLDNTVRLWDIRSSSPQGQLNLTTPYLCAYDPTATVIAIASPAAQSILMYDARYYDKAPFATFEMRDLEATFSRNSTGGPSGTSGDWTKLEFSNDGKRVLLATNGPGHYVLDSFEGHLEAYCVRPQGSTNRVNPSDLGALRERQSNRKAVGSVGASGQGDACLSPDGRYVVGGSGESAVYVWDPQGGEFGSAAEGADRVLRPSAELTSKGTGAAAVVAYNPRHNLLVTADDAVVFWLPEMD